MVFVHPAELLSMKPDGFLNLKKLLMDKQKQTKKAFLIWSKLNDLT